MDFQDEHTVFKRGKRGKRISGKAVPKWAKLKFGNSAIDINRKITIGRDEGCDITFKNDVLISREHACIEQVGGSYYVTDLGSTNGTYVNKTPLKKGKRLKLKKGDTVTVGNQRLKIT
ncbi:MAG TPA: FHA domain-containing protein [Spirochaetota bacterium]|nr:FHA domain-containing protein [Spirochaetota bacterium]